MSQIGEYPQDAKPVKSRRVLKIVIGSVVAAVVVVALSWGGVAWANGIAAQRAHDQAVAAQHQVAVALPHLEAQTAAIADESDTSSADDVVAAEKTREAAVLAAQQAAAEAAYAAAQKAAKAHHTYKDANGLIACPPGSSANSGDETGATSCFPDVCFHTTLPDPAYPQCVNTFKP
jgi:hypothetical protein